MNRNEIYNFLKDAGLTPRFTKMKRGYYVSFSYDDWKQGFIDFGFFFVRGFSEIALCTREIVIISKYEDMKINVEYKYIKEIDVHEEIE